MSDHYVTVSGTAHDPEIAFKCRGDRDSECHNYPDCDCEAWDSSHPHPRVTHDECWLQGWFDSDQIDPSTEDGTPAVFAELVGKSGPIKITFMGDCIEWSFDE